MLLVVRNISKSTNENQIKDSESEKVLKGSLSPLLTQIVKREQYNTIIFMENISKKLELPRNTWGIACVLYHRSVLNIGELIERGEIDKAVHAAACVFLASKVDDNPRDLKAFCKLVLKHPVYGPIYENDEKKVREMIIDTEYLILQNTGFDFEIELPYVYLNESKSILKHKDNTIIFKKAESFLNECFRSDLCLYHPPQVLAAAALYMSFRFLRIEMQDLIIQDKQFGGVWTESTDVSCYEKPEKVNNGEIEINVKQKEDFFLRGEKNEKMQEEEEIERPMMSLTLKMSKDNVAVEEKEPEKASLIFCLKKSFEEFDDCNNEDSTSSEDNEVNEVFLGKRSSPCYSDNSYKSGKNVKKLKKKEKFYEEKFEGRLELEEEKEKSNEEDEEIVTNLTMKKIKSMVISSSSNKKIEKEDFKLNYEEFNKISLKRSASEKCKKERFDTEVMGENEKSSVAFWWNVFGDDVDLLTILNISENIYSQLKISKE